MQEAILLLREALGEAHYFLTQKEKAGIPAERVAQFQSSAPLERDLSPQEEDLSIVLASLLHEQNMLEEAEHYLQRGLAGNRKSSHALDTIERKILLAYIKQARGEEEQATRQMEQAVQLAQHYGFSWAATTPSVLAAQAHLALMQGKEETVLWAEGQLQREIAQTTAAFQREIDEMMLARIQLTQNRQTEARALLARLSDEAAEAGRGRNGLEIRVLQAQNEFAQGQTSQAFHFIDIALHLAESEGYRRIFLDKGESMRALLRAFRAQHAGPMHFVETLLHAFPQREGDELRSQHLSGTAQPLLKPLSARELEILHLVASGASNHEIAEQLVVAESTVKRHLQHIFDKLAVRTHTQAIAHARELKLI